MLRVCAACWWDCPLLDVLGVVDLLPSVPLAVHIQTILEGVKRCLGCGTQALVKDRDRGQLVDLPAFRRPTRLVWHKRRWACPAASCALGSWTEQAPAIASPRLVLTARAGRWATLQVGRHGRTVAEVAVVSAVTGTPSTMPWSPTAGC